jgi:AraC family transcriptional regulator, transcriptional activator of pobA
LSGFRIFIKNLLPKKQELFDLTAYLRLLKQHEKLAIRVSSQAYGRLPPDIEEKYLRPHRKQHYFFLFVIRGSSFHLVDLQPQTVRDGELLFVLPHQIHQLQPYAKTPEGENGRSEMEYYKMSFDQTCLSLLPRPFPFLVNPLNNQRIHFGEKTAHRAGVLFGLLSQLLLEAQTPTELVLAHLSSLLTEIDLAYFSQVAEAAPKRGNLSKFIQFKLLIEAELTEQASIETIASRLAVNSNSLYTLVKQFSGLSPKAFITSRLILEAQRRLYYSEASVKELAFDLGFNDPDYFSRLFRKVTGKSVAGFLAEIQVSPGRGKI